MKLIRSLVAILIALTFSLFGSSAFAASVDIVNAGFEDPVLANGAVNYGLPNGWTSIYDPASVYDPYPGDPGFTPPWYNLGTFNPNGTYSDPPEGDNVGFVYIGVGDSFDDDYPLGMEQTLSSTLEANSIYTLNVEVGNATQSGNSEDFTGFGGYRIELLAGGTVIAADDSSASPGEGLFDMASLSFVTGSSHPLLDMVLGIRLIHLNEIDFASTITDWASEIAFDNVQLDVSPVPVPAAVWLFGTALVGLVGLGKRRKLT